MANFMSSGPHLTTETTSFLPRILRFHSRRFPSFPFSAPDTQEARVPQSTKKMEENHWTIASVAFVSWKCLLRQNTISALQGWRQQHPSGNCFTLHGSQSLAGENRKPQSCYQCKSINIQAVVNVFHELDLPFRQNTHKKKNQKKNCCQETFFCCSNEATVYKAMFRFTQQLSKFGRRSHLKFFQRGRGVEKKTSHAAMRWNAKCGRAA